MTTERFEELRAKAEADMKAALALKVRLKSSADAGLDCHATLTTRFDCFDDVVINMGPDELAVAIEALYESARVRRMALRDMEVTSPGLVARSKKEVAG